MLAAHDQENMAHSNQQLAAGKPLNQSMRGLHSKTPGPKYPKTPIRIPLNDENSQAGFGGKSGREKGLENLVTGRKKGAASDKHAFITPIGPRTRAPLGVKTTNAKARPIQTPAGPEQEKELRTKQASARKPKKIIHADEVKLEVQGGESPLSDRDIEYCPPRPKDRPYESEDFPDNCLDYSHIRPENLTKGVYSRYNRKLNHSGISEQNRKYEEAYEKDAREADEAVAMMMDEEWTVGDIPETFRHLRKKQQGEEKAKVLVQPKKLALSAGPATIASKKAASILSVPSEPKFVVMKSSKLTVKPSILSRKTVAQTTTVPSNPSTMRHTAATAASKSTIGYTKGRSVPNIIHRPERGGLIRSVSNLSQDSDKTITPANFSSEQEWRNPGFLKAFEIDDEDLEPGLRGVFPESLRRSEGDDEEFVMVLGAVD